MRVRIPPSSYLRLQSAHHRGDHLRVLAEGDAVAHEIKNDPDPGVDTDQWLAEAALMVGAAHVAYERLEVASTYLEYGVAMWQRVPGGGRAATGPAIGANAATRPARVLRIGRPSAPPVGLGEASRASTIAMTQGPFGTGGDLPNAYAPGAGGAAPFPGLPNQRIVTGKLDTSATDWAELQLLEIAILLGRYDDALARITPLLDPMRPTTTRFTATRAQASIAALRGDDETAHFLLNTATGVANRVPSQYRVALVEGDRSMVLAGQGRTREAVAIADRLLGKLVRPAVGAHQLWSNAEGAAIALTLSRATANEGDVLTAHRLLLVGEQAAQPVGRALFAGHVSLARGVSQALAGDHDGAESSLLDALQLFGTYGYRPAAALTLLEQGRLAHRRGLVRTARQLYGHALDELRAIGQVREVRVVRRLLDALDDQRPPVVDAGAAARPFPRYPTRT